VVKRDLKLWAGSVVGEIAYARRLGWAELVVKKDLKLCAGSVVGEIA
jgi:hypothetical protein